MRGGSELTMTTFQERMSVMSFIRYCHARRLLMLMCRLCQWIVICWRLESRLMKTKVQVSNV